MSVTHQVGSVGSASEGINRAETSMGVCLRGDLLPAEPANLTALREDSIESLHWSLCTYYKTEREIQADQQVGAGGRGRETPPRQVGVDVSRH